jgi:hypothetical protein
VCSNLHFQMLFGRGGNFRSYVIDVHKLQHKLKFISSYPFLAEDVSSKFHNVEQHEDYLLLIVIRKT